MNSDKNDEIRKHYYLKVIYFNSKEKRMFVSKYSGLGRTINFANPIAVILFIATILAVSLLAKII